MSHDASIIVCDDEIDLAHEIGEFFQGHDWRVLVCGTAEAARKALLAGFAPQCLLTDLRLNEASGADLISFARQLPPYLRPRIFALITGHAADPEVASLGADLIFFKPADPFDILSDLERLTREPGTTSELPPA
ncbi:response regulator [Afifella pfennigii]|uniref:response regulator n=1 Tax=Afifella pfennigii TaxID=209897 RepID=UPI0005517C59|nr:response regulator [Afifella pfennigii]